MKALLIFLYVVSLTICCTTLNAQITSGTITVIISGFHNDKGSVGVELFNNADAFPKESEKAASVIYSKIDSNKSVVVFEHIPKGEYAISVYHDENDNKKMDTKAFGIPKEGVGASNDAKGHLGPPKYKDAKFMFDGTSKTISIHIAYL